MSKDTSRPYQAVLKSLVKNVSKYVKPNLIDEYAYMYSSTIDLLKRYDASTTMMQAQLQVETDITLVAILFRPSKARSDT